MASYEERGEEGRGRAGRRGTVLRMRKRRCWQVGSLGTDFMLFKALKTSRHSDGVRNQVGRCLR